MKKLLVVVFLLLVLLVSAPFMVPTDTWRSELEARLNDATGMPITLGKLGLQLAPRPRIELGDIRVTPTGGANAITIQSIRVYPQLRALLDRHLQIDHIEIDTAVLPRETLGLLKLVRSGTTGAPINPLASGLSVEVTTIRNVSLLNSRIDLNGQRIGPLDARLTLDQGMVPVDLSLQLHNEQTSGVLRVNLHAIGIDTYSLEANASDYDLPGNKPVRLTRFQANGNLTDGSLQIHDYAAELWDGQIGGNITALWGLDWKLQGHIDINGIDLDQLRAALDKPGPSGTLTGSFDGSTVGPLGTDLLRPAIVSGQFSISDGVLTRVDLNKAAKNMSGKESTDGQTPFDELRGVVDHRAGITRLSNINITSDALEVSGFLTVQADRSLDGELAVGLKNSLGLLNVPVRVAGSVDEPALRPTRSAVIGGAVGTAILGPGLGTAVGIKAGQLLNKLGNLGAGNADNNDASKRPARVVNELDEDLM